MKILVIGGGIFLGRAVVGAALTAGHQVTVFNRGQASANNGFPVTWIRGDRDGDLVALQGGRWDVVVDTCGYFPRQIRRLLHAVGGTTGCYVFISTVAAYRNLGKAGIIENDALAEPAGDEVSTVTPTTYGPLKSGCEAAAIEQTEMKTLIVRPGVIAGPYDPTDRFSYWVGRMAAGGEVLAPGDPGAPLQIIDVRDLAEWLVRMIEAGSSGVYNTVGPVESLTFGGLLDICAREFKAGANLRWLSDDWLAKRFLADWSKLPLYMPKSNTATAGLFQIDGSKAFSSGLSHRPLRDTIADTHAWLESRAQSIGLKVGLTRSVEREFLAAWMTETRGF